MVVAAVGVGRADAIVGDAEPEVEREPAARQRVIIWATFSLVRLGSPLPRKSRGPSSLPLASRRPPSATSVCQVKAGPRACKATPVVNSFMTEATERTVLAS